MYRQMKRTIVGYLLQRRRRVSKLWYATDDVICEAELQMKRTARKLISTALSTGIPVKGEHLEAATALLSDVISADQLNAAKSLLKAGITEDNFNEARAAKAPLADDLFAGIDESVFHDIVTSEATRRCTCGGKI